MERIIWTMMKKRKLMRREGRKEGQGKVGERGEGRVVVVVVVGVRESRFIFIRLLGRLLRLLQALNRPFV